MNTVSIQNCSINSMVPYKLRALKHPKVIDIIKNEKHKIFELLNALGSPIHILIPEIFTENIAIFSKAFSDAKVDGKVHYAHKANKSASFIEMCAKSRIGIDASGLYEMRNALVHGIRGDLISVNSPNKDSRLLMFAILHKALLVIDSLEELNRLTDLIVQILPPYKVPILLRFDGSSGSSRFGLTFRQLQESYLLIKKYNSYLEFQGFAFHIKGYNIPRRAETLFRLCAEIEKVRELGFYCDTIDIGGGYTVSYVEKEDWEAFSSLVSPEMFHDNRKLLNFYPYHSEITKGEFLRSILEYTLPNGEILSKIINQLNIKIIIEAGRSLLDQAGLTAFSIQGVRDTDEMDYGIVTVTGNSFSMSEQWFNSEFAVDPILLSSFEKKQSNQTWVGCVAGNTSLEADIVSWRKISFPEKPKVGDVLVYLNTAGYQMDSNESEFHHIPLPQKISFFDKKGIWNWCKDEQFSQSSLLDFD